MVIPKTHDKHHALLHGLVHRPQTTLFKEVCLVVEKTHFCFAHVVGDGVEAARTDLQGRGVNALAILHVVTANLFQRASISAIGCDELGDHCHFLAAVNLKARTLAKELLIAKAEGVDVASILVTDTVKSMVGIVTTLRTLAPGVLRDTAGMGCVGSADAVCFPDVHFRAASAVVTNAGVFASSSRWPHR